MNSHPSRFSSLPAAVWRRGRWVLYPLLALLACTSLLFGWIWFKSPSIVGPGAFQPPEMAAAQFSSRDVVGDLGGMPVTIPRHFANYVEYDGDPGFGEKRQGPRPQRTHKSRMRSFGFDVRYPDMAGLSSNEMYADKKSYSIHNTPWIRVGITTGEDYPGHGALDRRTRARVEEQDIKYPRWNYTKLPRREYDLTVFAQMDIDPKTQIPYREDKGSDDIFIHRNKSGRVSAFIKCSNAGHAGAPCQHTFSLEPDVSALVYMSYRRTLLPEWKGIQENVKQFILGFRDDRFSSINQTGGVSTKN